MIISHEELQKLYKTGWQSWSWKNPDKTLIKLPTNCFPPHSADIPLSMKVDITLKPPAKGWCSYHAFRHNINEKLILDQAKAFHINKLDAFEYMIIDGGWEKEWGGFEVNRNKFPKGFKHLVKELKIMGFKAGIWFSPFLVIPYAKVVQDHPEWIVKDAKGNFVEGMRITPLDRYFPFRKYMLDFTQQKVINYIENAIAWLIEDCQFSLIKLDWLYGIYFNPRVTMDQADAMLRAFLLRIKKKYPHVYTNGCGCPLIPALGTVDSMRIAPDNIDPRHQSIPILKDIANQYFYKLALNGAKTRGWTKKYWNVDLDAFMCRDPIGLSDQQILTFQQALLKTNSNIFLGDDITTLSKERIEKFIRPLISNNYGK